MEDAQKKLDKALKRNTELQKSKIESKIQKNETSTNELKNEEISESL